ncbi:MAG: hypothetical protein ACOC2W_00610 [bacterium]
MICKCGNEIEQGDNFCSTCGEKIEWPEIINTTIYVHKSNESLSYEGKELGLTGDALEIFSGCCYEIGLDVEVDFKTGDVQFISMNEMKLLTDDLKEKILNLLDEIKMNNANNVLETVDDVKQKIKDLIDN